MRADLEGLRLRKLEMDTIGSPEPAFNEGATVRSGDPDSTASRAKVFVDGMGDF